MLMCEVTYLMATMTLGTLSICMTVIILNVHHRGASQRIPAWLRSAAFFYLARLLCVKTPFGNDTKDSRPQQSSSSAAINVDDSPPPSPIEPIWKRRSDAKPPSPPATKPPDLPRSCVRRDLLELTLSRMFRRSERPPSTASTCNGCAFVADSSAVTAIPPKRRRSRVNGALQAKTGNDPATIHRDLKAPSTDSTSTRDEVLSPLLKTPRLTTAVRRHSAVARRLDLAGRCRSDTAWSTLDSGESSTQYREDDIDADTAEQYANEWRELARILDRLCFWILLVLMTASGFVILLYPKYTGSESDWGPGVT